MNQSNSNGLEYKKQFSILAFVILHSCMNLPTAFITCLSRFFIKLRKVIHFDWGGGGGGANVPFDLHTVFYIDI